MCTGFERQRPCSKGFALFAQYDHSNRDRSNDRSEMVATIIGISGSLRRGSYNTALLRAAAQLMPDGTQLQIKTIRGFL